MQRRTTEFTPPMDCDGLGGSAFTMLDSARYDFRAMLADFNQYKGQAPKPDTKRLYNGFARKQKQHRSPFRNSYWDMPPELSPTTPLTTPPVSPKRRKTNANTEDYTGDQYETDLVRLDLCAQIRLLRTVDDTSDEEALTWSSSDDEEKEVTATRFLHSRH